MLEDGLGARRLVLAVDLSLGVGHVALDPDDFRHPGQYSVRPKAGCSQILSGEFADGSLDVVTGHSSPGVRWYADAALLVTLERRRKCRITRLARNGDGRLHGCFGVLVAVFRPVNADETLEHPPLAKPIAELTADNQRCLDLRARLSRAPACEQHFTEDGERVRLETPFAGRGVDLPRLLEDGSRLVEATKALERCAEAVQHESLVDGIPELTAQAKRRFVLL